MSTFMSEIYYLKLMMKLPENLTAKFMENAMRIFENKLTKPWFGSLKVVTEKNDDSRFLSVWARDAEHKKVSWEALTSSMKQEYYRDDWRQGDIGSKKDNKANRMTYIRELRWVRHIQTWCGEDAMTN